jgi:hypothetical protein
MVGSCASTENTSALNLLRIWQINLNLALSSVTVRMFIAQRFCFGGLGMTAIVSAHFAVGWLA